MFFHPGEEETQKPYAALITLVVLKAQTLEFLVKLSQLPATVQKAVYASPGRMGFRVNVQLDGVSSFAPSWASRVAAAIRHLDGDFVVVWMSFFFHFKCSWKQAALYTLTLSCVQVVMLKYCIQLITYTFKHRI